MLQCACREMDHAQQAIRRVGFWGIYTPKSKNDFLTNRYANGAIICLSQKKDGPTIIVHNSIDLL